MIVMFFNLFKETLFNNKIKTIGIICLTVLIAVMNYISPRIQAYIINVIFVEGSMNGLLVIALILLTLAVGVFILNYVS